MKKNILCFGIILITLFVSCISSKQTKTLKNSAPSNIDTTGILASFKGDSIAYLNSLIAKKNDYIGKPLALFLKDIEIPVTFFSSSINRSNKFLSPGISIYLPKLNDNNAINKNPDNYDSWILIKWQYSQPMDSVQSIMAKNRNAGKPAPEWSSFAKDYFGKIIVADIELPYYLKK